MINILVTGASGQLGSEIKNISSDYDNYRFLFTDILDLDITNFKAVKKFVQKNDLNVIVNCAAYTAVDKAESEPEKANFINHLAVENLAKISYENKIKFIHISTDYVFDGHNYKPYVETDSTNPQSVYGSTKLYGELAMQKINPINSIIIRTSWVFSRNGKNFFNTMLELGKKSKELNVVSDQIGTPTFAGDLAKVILEIIPKINNTKVEIYHFSNEGVCSWYDFSKAIFELSSMKKVMIKPVSATYYKSKANRPYYSVLNKNKIKRKFCLEIPHWESSLKNLLDA